MALIIILITATGIFASFLTAKRYVNRSTRRILALNFARQKLEELRTEVRQDTWDSGGLKVTGSGVWTPADGETLPGDFGSIWQGKRYYSVEAVTSPVGTKYRKVTVKITWSELTP